MMAMAVTGLYTQRCGELPLPMPDIPGGERKCGITIAITLLQRQLAAQMFPLFFSS